MNYLVGKRTKVKGQVGLYVYRGQGLADGKPKLCYYFTIKGAGYTKVGWNYEGYTVDDAKAARAKAVQTMREGGTLRPTPTWKLQQAVERYLAWAKATGMTTIRADRGRFQNYCRGLLGKPVTQINQNDVMLTIRRAKAAGCSSQTQGCFLHTWRRLFKFLAAEEQVSKDPTSFIKLKLQAPRRRERYLEEDEVRALLGAIENKIENARDSRYRRGWMEARAQALLGLEMGMRRSEWISPPSARTTPDRDYGLRWEYIDWSTQQIHVRGKGLKDRVLPMSDGVIEALQALGPQTRGPVFKEASYNKLTKLFDELGFNDGLDYNKDEDRGRRVTLHTLRHTFATYAMLTLKDTKRVAEFLGHSETRTTELYTHLVKGELSRGMGELNGVFRRMKSPAGNVVPFRRPA